MSQNGAHRGILGDKFKDFIVARELHLFFLIAFSDGYVKSEMGPLSDLNLLRRVRSMKMHIALLSLLTVCCLMLAVAPAMADVNLYDNGPLNGTNDAWTVNFGFSVSNSFVVPSNSIIIQWHWVYWDASSTDLVTTADVAFGSTSFGGTPETESVVSNVFLGTNQFGYNLYGAWYRLNIPLAWSGAGYITLSNVCTTSGCSVSNPIYWDENSGVGCTSPGCPSTAYENTLGSIPSEAFTLTGTTGTTPEPSSIMLFGSGILGLAGVLRRKLIR
jgi:hypothetical protein